MLNQNRHGVPTNMKRLPTACLMTMAKHGTSIGPQEIIGIINMSNMNDNCICNDTLLR